MKKRGAFFPVAIILVFVFLGILLVIESTSNKQKIGITGFAISDACSDSDEPSGIGNRGNITTINGTVTWNNGGGNIFYFDACISTTMLRENYCNSTNDVVTYNYSCPIGCSLDICVPKVCNDGDDGKDYEDKSSITGRNQTNFTQIVAAQDYCVNSTVLMEYYCGNTENDFVLNETKLCTHGCGDGECNSCSSNWNCTNWSACLGGKQNRTCNDLNKCTIPTNPQILNRTCTVCSPSWSCSSWSSCSTSGNQIRICTDLNNCGLNTNKPVESQSCIPPCISSWDCTDWEPEKCPREKKQTRDCEDLNKCNSSLNKPDEENPCEYKFMSGGMFIVVILFILFVIIAVAGIIFYLWKKNQFQNKSSYQPYQPKPPGQSPQQRYSPQGQNYGIYGN
jgi:hypothetical protein